MTSDWADECLFQLPDGAYALAWHTPEFLGDEYVFDFLDAEEAAHWCVKQQIDPPQDLRPHLNFLSGSEPAAALRTELPRRNFITVYEEGTSLPLRLDTENGSKWKGEGYGTDWGSCGYYNLIHEETLYFRKGWILVTESYHVEADLPSVATFRWLSDEDAANWFLENGHPVPDDVAQHVAGRFLDDAEPNLRDYEAERRKKAAALGAELKSALKEILGQSTESNGEGAPTKTAKQQAHSKAKPADVTETAPQPSEYVKVPSGIVSSVEDAMNQMREPKTKDEPPAEAPVEANAGDAATVEQAPASQEKQYRAKDYDAVAAEYLELNKDVLKKDPWLLTDRKVAEFIRERLLGCRCSNSTASGLPVIQAFKERRGPKPKRGPGKAPRVVSLTSKVEATIGRQDDELQRLIDEEEQEPSPLAPDPPDAPNRVKLGRRLP